MMRGGGGGGEASSLAGGVAPHRKDRAMLIERFAEIVGFPPNLPGRPTRCAVFGLMTRSGRPCVKLLFSGEFPDLEIAERFAAARERKAVGNGFLGACRVVWQHDVSVADIERQVRENWEVL